MKSIVLEGPLSSVSGYGVLTRQIADSLITYPEPVLLSFVDCQWGHCDTNSRDEYIPYMVNGMQEKPDLYIRCSIPEEFENKGKLSVGWTAGIESDRAIIPWIHGCNKMAEIVTTSQYSTEVLKNSRYGKKDSDVKIEILKPITTITPFCNETEPENVDDLMSGIKTKFNYLCVGMHSPQDRKNIQGVIVSYLQQPKPNKDWGLILKINGPRYCESDKHNLLTYIADIKKDVGRDLPIHLLYGNFTDSEIMGIYNHKRVSCMLSLSHGEGCGLPLLDFAMTGKPIIASGVGGQLDFLNKDNHILVAGQMRQVQPHHVNKWIVAESNWFYPALDEVFKAYEYMQNSYVEAREKSSRYNGADFSRASVQSKIHAFVKGLFI